MIRIHAIYVIKRVFSILFSLLAQRELTKAGKDKFYLIRVVTTHHFSK